MLDKIDPKASRPHFRTGEKLFVVAGKPGKAMITIAREDFSQKPIANLLSE